jgi:alkanesulfonate monooxygenase
VNLEFHWRMLQGGERLGVTRLAQMTLDEAALPDLAAQTAFCRSAVAAGISSLLVDLSYAKPDPMLLAAALAVRVPAVRLMVAVRSGLLSPTLFTQQVNTFSQLSARRICLNVVAGYSPEEQGYYGDFLSHDERYARTEEFLEICNRIWDGGAVTFHGRYMEVNEARIATPFADGGGKRPEIFVGGNSDSARDLAISQGSCWMRIADSLDAVRTSVGPVVASGKQVGLRLSIICATTRQEALRQAGELVQGVKQNGESASAEHSFVRNTDSRSIRQAWHMAAQEWLSPILWTGAVRTHGAPAIALVGDPDEVAAALIEYGDVGVSQFILSGWPKEESMLFFGREVIPRVRQIEAQRLRTDE